MKWLLSRSPSLMMPALGGDIGKCFGKFVGDTF